MHVISYVCITHFFHLQFNQINTKAKKNKTNKIVYNDFDFNLIFNKNENPYERCLSILK